MNTQKILSAVQKSYMKTDIPRFRPGDTVRVYAKVVEGESERIQIFEGVVLRRQGSGLSESFTVRKVSFGIGIERTFPLHSPRIDKIEPMKSGRAKRAKLFYLRNLSGKAARLSEKENKEPTAKEPVKKSATSEPSSKSPKTNKKNSPEPAVTH